MFRPAQNLQYKNDQIVQPISGLGIHGREAFLRDLAYFSNPTDFRLTAEEGKVYQMLAEEFADRGILIPQSVEPKASAEEAYLQTKFAIRRRNISFFSTAKASPFSSDLLKYEVAFLGLPYDSGSTRPGTRYGTEILREQSQNFDFRGSLFDLRSRKQVSLAQVCDVGDFADPKEFGADPYQTLKALYDRFPSNIVPFGVGGDHSFTYSAVKSRYEAHPDLHYVHLDSHTDLQSWPTTSNDKVFHSNFLSCLLRDCPGLQAHLLGVRPFTSVSANEVENFKIQIAKLQSMTFDCDSQSAHAASLPQQKKVYLSIDVDVLDCVTQTGHPNPGGMTLGCLEALIDQVFQNNQVVGLDLMEFGKSSERDTHRRESQLLSSLILKLTMKCLEQKVSHT